MFSRTIAIAVVLMLAPLAGAGQTTLRASFGWGDAVRLGHWTPVFVSVLDPQTRPVILELRGQHGLSSGIVIRQPAVVQPTVTLYALLYPLDAEPSKVTVAVIDRDSGKTLAWQLLEDPIYLTNSGRQPHQLVAGGDTLIGVSGINGTEATLQAQWAAAGLPCGFLQPDRLPYDAAGYQGLRVLMLQGVHLSNLEAAQEQAILDWVASGGNLLLWPGTDPVPEKDAIVAALPCDIGKNILLSDPHGSASGPAPVNARELIPRPGAELISIGAPGVAYSRRTGLGRITVLPADISARSFTDAAAARAYWRGILTGMADVHEPKKPHEVSDAEEDLMVTAPREQDTVGRETVATQHILQAIGANAEARRDVSGLLLAIAGILVVAGPVDSMLLYSLGRPPRNLLTLLAWLGMFAAGAGYVLAKPPSDPPKIQSFRLIDQVDDRAVAANDIVAVGSRINMTYPLSLDPAEWWTPARRVGPPESPFTEVMCEQDRQGSRPRSLHVEAGQWTAIQGEHIAPAAPILNAVLSISSDDNNPRIVGVINNLSSSELTNIRITTSKGSCLLANKIGAQARMDIDQALMASVPDALVLPAEFTELTPARTDRINELVKGGTVACITAQMPQARAIKVIEGVDAGNIQMIRAVVVLKVSR